MYYSGCILPAPHIRTVDKFIRQETNTIAQDTKLKLINTRWIIWKNMPAVWFPNVMSYFELVGKLGDFKFCIKVYKGLELSQPHKLALGVFLTDCKFYVMGQKERIYNPIQTIRLSECISSSTIVRKCPQ